MAFESYPANYALFNDYNVKKLNVVVCIEELDFCFGLVPTFTRVRYGDPDTDYGDPGLVYGGLRALDNVKPWLSTDSSLMLSQKLEPEQGRGSVSTLGLTFIDKDGYFTRLCSKGQILNELLGSKKVTVRMGYVDTSYPEDYFTVFRGYVSRTRLMPSKVMLELSDANLKRRQNIFFCAKTKLTAAIDDTALTIPVKSTARFFDHILGPAGSYDSGVRTFLKINDELIEYGPSALSPTSVAAIDRGALNTIAAAHDIDSDVQTIIELQDNVINLALKLMLSGWNDFFLKNIEVTSIVQTNDPNLGLVNNAFVISSDTIESLGLAIGDYFQIAGSTVGNNLYGRIVGFDVQNDSANRVIYTDQTFTVESPSTGVTVNFRSQFDTLPVECGLQMRGDDVDVRQHIDIRNNFFSQAENRLRFVIDDQENGKSFIEKELFLPFGCYSLTRFGRVSAVITKPPVADQRLTFLDSSNVIEPNNIIVDRGLNTRRFYNEIQYNYDQRILEGDEYSSGIVLVDSQSLNETDQSSILPISSKGMRTDLDSNIVIERRGNYLLSRYKDAAYEINLNVNWQAGSLIETGDVVALRDDDKLKIANLTTGERNLGTQLFEVIERNMDIKSGKVQLKLLSNLGYAVNDRFGTISPSSVVGVGSTFNQIVLTPSYGEAFGLNEYQKYIDYVGLPIVVHDYNWTYAYEARIVGFEAVNPNIMIVSPALPVAPIAGDIVDIGNYPDTINPADSESYKLIHAFITPSLTVVSGASDTVFDVSLADAAKLVVGLPILIHNQDYTILSPEVIVDSVVGTTVTVEESLGFTPVAGQIVELVGYRDGGGPYRIL